jgi:hypothetical protein
MFQKHRGSIFDRVMLIKQIIENYMGKFLGFLSILKSWNLCRIDSTILPHTAHSWLANLSSLAFQALIATILFHMDQMKAISFLFLCFCHVLDYLNLKLGWNRLAHLLLTMFILGLTLLKRFLPNVKEYASRSPPLSHP